MPPTLKRTTIALALGCSALFVRPAAAAPAHHPAASASHPAAAELAQAPRRLFTYDTCSRVIEGDLIEGKKLGPIRLIGIIAPTKGETGWQKAIDATTRLTLGKQIKVEICSERPNDYRQRLRAVVYLPDQTNLNTKLLRIGVARLLERKPCHLDVARWQSYETSAREAKRGLWAPEAGGERTGERSTSTRPPEDTSRPHATRKRAARAHVRIRPRP